PVALRRRLHPAPERRPGPLCRRSGAAPRRLATGLAAGLVRAVRRGPLAARPGRSLRDRPLGPARRRVASDAAERPGDATTNRGPAWLRTTSPWRVSSTSGVAGRVGIGAGGDGGPAAGGADQEGGAVTEQQWLLCADPQAMLTA